MCLTISEKYLYTCVVLGSSLGHANAQAVD